MLRIARPHDTASPPSLKEEDGRGSSRRTFTLEDQGGNITSQEGIDMESWRCTICQYVYDPAEGDPDNGVPPHTSFEDLPDDWVCPVCGAGKELFEPA